MSSRTAVVWVIVSAAAAYNLLLARGRAARRAASERLLQARADTGAAAGSHSRARRPWRPLRALTRMLERAGEALPGRVRERLSSNLFPPAFSVLGIDYLLGIRIFATVCAPLAVVSATRFSIPGLALAVPCAVAGYALPMLMIRAEEARHSEAVRKALPDMADLMYVLVLGGRNLDQAFRTAARVSSEPLRSMLAGPVKEMDLGSTREQCFNALLERHPVPELSSLLRSLLEAERLGFPPAGTLEVFAREIRLRRRDQVRVAAAKAPLKMLAPLVFLVLPSSLMLTVGPAFLVALSRGF